jgi:hypothetical protein
MTTDQLRSAITSRPFQPFILHLADGRSIPVPHPEWIAYPGGRIATVFTAINVAQVVDLLLVTGLEIKLGEGSRPPRRKKGNGTS